MMTKTFVQRRRDVTQEELMEFNAFCQMLPGASSTQTIALIGYKRGGVPLATLTIILWMLPATLAMGAFSFLIHYLGVRDTQTNIFVYIRPMSVGFVCFAASSMMRKSVKHTATAIIMVASLIVTVLIRSPWVFPAILIAAGTASNFSNRRIPDVVSKPKRIQWFNLWLFAVIFLSAGIMSELARTGQWEHRRVFNLFENFYRFGTIVFGGGQALLPMMLYQFVQRPIHQGHAQWFSPEELMTGYGMVQALPGPVFSICTYVGGLALSGEGPLWQIIGCITATTAVFLPSTLLLFFLFPVYQNLKQHVIIFRALEGINAAIAGIVWATGFVLFQSVTFEWTNVVVVIITFCLLFFTKIPSPLIVVGWLLLGWAMYA